MLLGPDAVEAALRNKDKAFANKPAWTRLVGPFFGGGLMLIDFDEHHVHRRIMQEAFTRDRLEGTPTHAPGHRGRDGGLGTPSRASRPLEAQAAHPRHRRGHLQGGAESTSRAEMDAVNRAFISCVQAAAGIVRRRALHPLGSCLPRSAGPGGLPARLPARSSRHRTDDIFSVLATSDRGRRAVLRRRRRQPHDLLDDGRADTSTITTSTILQLLGQHPSGRSAAVRSRWRSAEPTLAELEALPSIDLVMKEALRLRPVPVVVRKTVREVVVEGVRIPDDTDVVVAFPARTCSGTTGRTRRPSTPSASRRNGARTSRTCFAWSPFGGGVPKCIGLYFAGAEVKAIMHRLLRGHHWTVDPSYVAPWTTTRSRSRRTASRSTSCGTARGSRKGHHGLRRHPRRRRPGAPGCAPSSSRHRDDLGLCPGRAPPTTGSRASARPRCTTAAWSACWPVGRAGGGTPMQQAIVDQGRWRAPTYPVRST